MKQIITIKKNDQVIYQGRIGEIPIKETFIIAKSVELFDDEDPCIIHQSYVIKEYVDNILSVFKGEQKDEILVKNHLSDLEFLDFMDLEQLEIIMKG